MACCAKQFKQQGRDRLAVSRVVNDTSCEGAVSEFHDHMFF